MFYMFYLLKPQITLIALLITGPLIAFSPIPYIYLALWILLELLTTAYKQHPLSKGFLETYSNLILTLYPGQICSDFKRDEALPIPGVDDTIVTERGKRISGILFVANHQLYGLEIPLLYAAIYKKTGVWPSLLLSDSFPLQIPVVSHVLTYLFCATSNMEGAFKKGDCLLYFPGRFNEMLRTKKMKSHIPIWENNMEFARLALEFDYKIVTVGCVGIEENLWRLADIPGSAVFKRELTTKYMCLPLTTFFPNQRVYVAIGSIVSCKTYNEKADIAVESQSKTGMQLPTHLLLRDAAKQSLVDCLLTCKGMQHEDPQRYFFAPRD